MQLGIEDFTLKGIGLSAVMAIILNIVLPKEDEKSVTPDL